MKFNIYLFLMIMFGINSLQAKEPLNFYETNYNRFWAGVDFSKQISHSSLSKNDIIADMKISIRQIGLRYDYLKPFWFYIRTDALFASNNSYLIY